MAASRIHHRIETLKLPMLQLKNPAIGSAAMTSGAIGM